MGKKKNAGDEVNTEAPAAEAVVDDSQGAEAADSDAQETRDSFLGRVGSAWRDTVGAYATDEGETENLFKRLVSFGTLTTEEAKSLFVSVKDKIEDNRRELDDRIEDSIRRTVELFSIPSPADLSEASARLDAINKRLEQLESQQK